jgi:hypothetical protein
MGNTEIHVFQQTLIPRLFAAEDDDAKDETYCYRRNKLNSESIYTTLAV